MDFVLSKYIKLKPHPKQLAFLLLPHREAFYGGAGGGGKSVALMMCALQYVDYPNYHALLLRREYPQLANAGGLIPLSHDWLTGTDAQWEASRRTWTFPSGATLEFGHMATETDKHNYEGRAFSFIGFDEVTHFTESQYLHLFGWLRKTEKDSYPLRVRATSNPGGFGHEWVKRRFVNPRNPDRPFVRATITDNPAIDENEYLKSLERLDIITRKRIAEGDWDIMEQGGMFRREWFADKIIELSQVPAKAFWMRSWDRASTAKTAHNSPDWTVGAKVGYFEGRYYIDCSERFQGSPLENEKRIKLCANLDGQACEIIIEREGGASGKDVENYYRTQVLPALSVNFVSPTGSKIERAKPFASACEAGNVFLINREVDWISGFLDRLTAFPQEGVHDDEVDAISQAINFIFLKNNTCNRTGIELLSISI